MTLIKLRNKGLAEGTLRNTSFNLKHLAKHTDPEGFIVNKDLIEIEETATYLEDDFNGDGELDDRIWITERKIGNYFIAVVAEPDASPTDTYTLEVLGDNVTIVLAENVLISDIPTQPYQIISTETGITTAPVGGIYILVNKLELLAPYIGLTTLLSVTVMTVGYVKRRKRNTQIIS